MELRLVAALSSWRSLLAALPSLGLEDVLGALSYEAETRRRKEVMKRLIVRAARLQSVRTLNSLAEMYDMHVPSRILHDDVMNQPKAESKPRKSKTAKKKAVKKKK